MPKNYKKSFEIERKIERRSLLAERERKTFEKLSASGAQKLSFLANFQSALKLCL